MFGAVPPWFVAGMLLIVMTGFLLPLRLEGRQDHVVVTISNGVAGAVLGIPAVLLLWGAALAAVLLRLAQGVAAPAARRPSRAATRQSLIWIGASALACSAGSLAGYLVWAEGFDGTFPIQLTDTRMSIMGFVTALVAWWATMGARLLSQRVLVGTTQTFGLDALDSPLIPYLLPLVGGYPLVAAGVALYRPDQPLATLAMTAWCIPLHAASAFDVNRRQMARELRRDAFARQRLAAIGEVSARIVHQSRHQVGLMGWSIHRLRSMANRPGGVDVRVMRAELDALAEAKDRLSEMLAAELLHESTAPPSGVERPEDAGGTEGSADAVARLPVTIADVIADVTTQLREEAEREGVDLRAELAGDVADAPAAAQLHDVVFNLVDNAIDAAEGEVVVRLRPPGDPAAATTIVVEDDGPGLDEQDGTRAFEPFFTTKPDGTGMGLAIADALVGDLGGELRYERLHGRTSFLVVLPAPLSRAG